MIWRSEAVFCKRAIESAEQDEQNIMQRFHEDQKSLGFFRNSGFVNGLKTRRSSPEKKPWIFFHEI
jgi:hypothetical protein